MYNFLTRNGQLVSLGLGLLVIAIFLISTLLGFNADSAIDLSTDLNAYEGKSDIKFFNPGIGATVFLIFLAAFLALVVFGIINLMKFPKGAIKFGLGFLALIIVFFILYATSSVETEGKLGMLHQREGIEDGISKLISGGLKTTIILALGAFGIMVVSELRNIFK
ncbi:MAG TPA: hypothetical protein PKC30_14200 [Saprospiraceae bacterium]|nr:hypothetical protein [Saprospiraceae bacterium]